MLQASLGWHRGAALHKTSSNVYCGNDVALFTLADSVSPTEATPVTPLVDAPIMDHTRVGTSLAALGYRCGASSDRAMSSVKRATCNTEWTPANLGCGVEAEDDAEASEHQGFVSANLLANRLQLSHSTFDD